MIEIVVLVFTMVSHSVKTYIWEDIIIKEYTYHPAFDSLYANRYEIYDINRGDYYHVPKDEKVRVLQPKLKPVYGVWSVAGKVVTIIDTVQDTYQGFRCVIETSGTTTDTPFGPSDGKQIKYYADLSPVIPFKEEVVLYLLGVREFKYDPHLFLVKTINQYDVDQSFTIMSIDIRKERIEKDRFEEVLAYPVRFD